MIRTRSRGGFTNTFTATQKITYCDGSTSTTSSAPPSLLSQGVYEEMEDTVTPGFKRLSAAGQVIVSPMSRWKETRTASASPAADYWTCACSGANVKGVDWSIPPASGYLQLPSYLAMPEATLQSLRTSAYTSAMSGVAAPDVMGLVDIAEARKTISGLARLSNDFYSTVTALRQGGEYKAWIRKRSLKDSFSIFSLYMSQNWLRWRYMFLPLMMSANGLVDALGRKKPPLRETSRGFASDTISDSYTTPWYLCDGYAGNFNSRMLYTRTTSAQVRAGVLYENIHGVALTRRLGVEAHQIPAAVWELVSFSFVVDWFLNIGDLVEAVSPKVGVKQLGSWTSEKITSDISWSIELFYIPGGAPCKSGNSGSMTGVLKKEEYGRAPGGSLGLSMRTFEARWIDFIHLVDASALIRQFMNK